MGADDYEGDVGDEACNQINEVEKVTVTEADWVTIKHSNRDQEEKYMHVKIMVYYSSIRRGDFDADDLAYDLERMIRKSTGMPFILFKPHMIARLTFVPSIEVRLLMLL